MSSARANTSPTQRTQSEQQISVVVRGDGTTRVVIRHRSGGLATRSEAEDGSGKNRWQWRRIAGITVGVATVVTAVATVWLLLR
jgi:hypothetical protein